MRKHIFLLILLIAAVVAIAGCGDSEPERTLVSKPVVARQISEPSGSTMVVQSASSTEPETPVETVAVSSQTVSTSVASSGSVSCQQLSGSDLGGIFGGSWSKTADCPTYPMLPGGVQVCQCSFEGPGNLYFNVETQLYDDEAEAIRVFKMYCDDETNEIGDMSCRRVRSSATAPNFVYFLEGNYFVKVSCLGGDCALDGIADAAKEIEKDI